jgi:hypothetical protein
MSQNRNEILVKSFIQAYAKGDTVKLKSMLSDKLEFYVTNAQGQVDLLNGSNSFIQNVIDIGVKSVSPTIKIKQITSIRKNQVMCMVEVKAERKNKKLHNFAAFLIHILQNEITEVRMVEALPKKSDEFWKD